MKEELKEIKKEFELRDKEIVKDALRDISIDVEMSKTEIEKKEDNIKEINKKLKEFEKNKYKIEHHKGFDIIKIRTKREGAVFEHTWKREFKIEADAETGKTKIVPTSFRSCGSNLVANYDWSAAGTTTNIQTGS